MMLQSSLRNLAGSVRQSRRRIGDRPLVKRNPRMARIVQSQLGRPSARPQKPDARPISDKSPVSEQRMGTDTSKADYSCM
jgi:hypothetical protein